MNSNVARYLVPALSVCVLAVLAACSSSPMQPAPVEDRGQTLTSRQTSQAKAMSVALPGAENAGKPGYYTVQKGDTLTRIGLDHGQSWRDLARWNNLNNPDAIEVGQVVRVVPPGSAVDSTGVIVHPVGGAKEQAAAITPAKTASAPASVAPAASAPANTASAPRIEEALFTWPANGQVIAGFDEAKNKGIDIAGKAGDPVLAAADGQVVYAGAGLRGYGNLIIVKHNNTYLTAYAHNQKLLVKEDQKVRRGDKIAEMGSSDADRVKLHFEVRRQGKPVDPSKFLAAR
jgi:lipoprotein NlpD